jgi:hypothetical protein
MVIAVIAAGPIITAVEYIYSLFSAIGSFVIGMLGMFLPF